MRTALITSLVVMLCAGSLAAQKIEDPQDGSQEVAPAKPEVRTHLPLAAIFLGSLGAVTVAVGAGFGWQADEEYEDYKDNPTEKLADDVETHAVIADVLMFTGGAAVIGSVLWWWLGYGEAEEAGHETGAATASTQPQWRAVIGPGQAGLTVEF